MLATGALVASILAVAASPTAAQPGSTVTAASPDHNPEWGADWSACVGSAGTHDAAFSDVDADSVHADNINCIAYYEITLGKGDGLYGPDEHVTAFQMDLFVRRAADRMGADGEAVLTDVKMSDPVTRVEMARLMFGLVNDIDDDVRFNPRDNDIEFDRDGDGVWTVVDDFFADVTKAVPFSESQQVGAAYEMGITRGTKGDGTLVSTPDSTFEPFEPVTRAQMASFIARTLDHSNLRPEGLSVQRNLRKETQVSLRDGEFEPMDDALIDVFSAQYDADAFDEDDGECELRFVRDETPSHSTCEIDIGDQPTDDEGNVVFTLVSDVDPVTATCSVGTGNLDFLTDTGSESRAFWAWTGDSGDEVDSDTELQELEDVTRPVGMAAPDYGLVSGGLPTDDELAKMGETVTFTLQLKDQVGGKRNHDKDTDVGPDRSRNRYVLTIEKYFVTRVPNTDSDTTDKSGTASTGLFPEAPGDWNYGTDTLGILPLSTARFQVPFDMLVHPDADGKYIVTLRHPDLNAGSNDNDVGVRFTLRPFTTANDLLSANLVRDIDVVTPGTNYAESTTNEGPPAATTGSDTVTGHVIFSDDASDAHAVSGETLGYRIIAGNRTGNSVTVKVIDQYGDPMRGVEFWLHSNLDGVGDLNNDGDFEDDGESPDQVVYPEEVDRTVQSTEDEFRTDVDSDAATVDVLDDAGDASPGATTSDDRPGLIWIRRAAPGSHLVDSDNNPATPLERVVFAADTTPTEAAVDAVFVDVSHPYWVVNDNATADNTLDDFVVRRHQVAGPLDSVSSSFRPLQTRRDGTYRVGYSYIGTAAQTETIVPSVIRIERRGSTLDPDRSTADVIEPLVVSGQPASVLTYVIDRIRAGESLGTPDTNGLSGVLATNDLLSTVQGEEVADKPVRIYWAKVGNNARSRVYTDPADTSSAAANGAVSIRVRDVANKAIVVNEPTLEGTDTDNPMVYYYDEDDNFSIEGVGVTFEMFEEALKKTWKDDELYAYKVEWENYTLTRPGRVSRTIWELGLSCSEPPAADPIQPAAATS